jgi:hypothetical protein
MIESERELLATQPAEQIAHWAKQVEKARIKRSRYQDQEAEGLMTCEELRVKLAELEETIILAEGEIEKLRCHEERILSLEKSGEELLACYAELVPSEIESLCPKERRHIYQLLRVEVSDPKEGEIKIRLPFLPDNEGFCRKETAHVTVYNTQAHTLTRATSTRDLDMLIILRLVALSDPAPRRPELLQQHPGRRVRRSRVAR